MALTDKNKLQVAYKKLLGKSQTNTGFLPAQEVPTAFQAASSFVFGDTVPTDENSANASNVVKKVTLGLEPISQYKASVDNGTGTISGQPLGFHSFALKLQQEITINSVLYGVGEKIKDHNELQIVPDIFGPFYYPSFFNNGTKIDKNSVTNWFVDPFSGILWVQDLNEEFDGTMPAATSATVEVYIYTGDFLDQKVQAASQTGGVIGTTSDDLLIVDIDAPGDTDTIEGKVSIIFEDPVGSEPQPDYKAAIAYQEGQLEFYTQNLNINNIVMTLSGSELSASSIKAFGPQSSVQYHNLLGKISGSEYFVWDEENLFLTASNLFTNTITSSVLTSSNIVGYGTEGSVQFKNSESYISGSENFIWNNITNTLTASNISASNIEAQTSTISSLQSNTITTTTLNANNISVENITISGEGSSVPAAGLNTQIQYNDNGKLGASDKLTFGESSNIFSLKANDSANNNSAELFINTDTTNSTDTSGLLLSNMVDNSEKQFKIDSQYDNTNAIYKIDSDLPLYINSDIQNLLTAGTSKLDMSAGKVELWSTSSKYLKVNTDNITTNISNFIFENSSGDILVDTNDISVRFRNTGITIVGDTTSYIIGDPFGGNSTLISRSFAKINFGLSLDTNYYSTIDSDTRSYQQVINPENGDIEIRDTSYQSFSVKVHDQLDKILEINKDGIVVEQGDITSQGNIHGEKEIYVQDSPVSTVNHVSLEDKYTIEYVSVLDHTVQHEIMRFPIVAGKRYRIDVEMYISWHFNRIYQYNSTGQIVVDSGNPLLTFGTPAISMAYYVDDSAVLFSKDTLHRNIYKYTKTGTLGSTEPKYTRDLLFSTPFPKSDNTNIFSILDVETLDTTTGNNSQPDLMLSSFSSFIIELPYYSGNSEISIWMIPSAPSTDVGDSQNLIDYNTTNSQGPGGPGHYHYLDNNEKTSLSVNTPTNIKITRIF